MSDPSSDSSPEPSPPPSPTSAPSPPPEESQPRPPRSPEAILTNFFLRILRRPRLAQDAKRRAIIRELIQTEKNYVDSLLICEEVYYNPLDRSISSKSPLIDAASLAQLFGNLDEIRAAHQVIVREMDAVLPRLKKPYPPRSFYLRIIAGFDEILPRMHQLYTQYLASNCNAEDILKRLSKHKKFRSFLSECLFNPRSKCQEIEDLLILPTQRVAGYKMLFERVLKYFPAATFGAILEAYKGTLDALLRVGASMNQEKADTGSQEKLLTIAETLSKIPPEVTILKPGRKYLGVVNAQWLKPNGKTQKHVFFVTSDLLIIGQQAEGVPLSKWIFRDAIPIIQIRFAVIKNDKYIERGFVLKSDTENYSFIMKDAPQSYEFMDSIKAQKKAIKQQVERQTQEGAEYMQGLVSQITTLYESPVTPLSREEALDSVL
jgi:hypothetical protein